MIQTGNVIVMCRFRIYELNEMLIYNLIGILSYELNLRFECECDVVTKFGHNSSMIQWEWLYLTEQEMSL